MGFYLCLRFTNIVLIRTRPRLSSYTSPLGGMHYASWPLGLWWSVRLSVKASASLGQAILF